MITELDFAQFKDTQQKQSSRNIYAKTREESEILLAQLIKETKAEIQAEKELTKKSAPFAFISTNWNLDFI